MVDQQTVDVLCPICGQDMTLYIDRETEKGEYGSVLASYYVVSTDPRVAIAAQACRHDFAKPLMEVWAEDLNTMDCPPWVEHYEPEHSMDLLITPEDVEALTIAIMGGYNESLALLTEEQRTRVALIIDMPGVQKP